MKGKIKKQQGITLVALIITIVVLLVLAAVAISYIFSDGIFVKAVGSTDKYEGSAEEEQGILAGFLGFIDQFFNGAVAPEDVFLWKSDNPNDEGYGTIIGYTANIDNYPSLRFPERCTKIEITYLEGIDDEETRREMRRYTGNIKEVELTNNIVIIGKSAFSDYEFYSLKKINIPKSVTEIGDSAFEKCRALTSITYEGTVEEWKNIPKGQDWKHGVPATYVQCTDGKVILIEGIDENYDVTDLFIWGSADPNSEGYGVLVGYTGITQNYPTLTIPDRCTKIKIDTSILLNTQSIRSYTSNIKELELPKTITEIGERAFAQDGWENYNFRDLSKITYNGTVAEWNEIELGENWCNNIPAIEVICSDGKVVIKFLGYMLSEDETYYICTGMGDITSTDIVIESEHKNLPVKKIGESAFEYCWELTSVTIPKSVTTIGNNAFNYCESLTLITYEGTVAEWNEIELGENWCNNIPVTEVICSDGKVVIKTLEYRLSSDETYYICTGIGDITSTDIVIESEYKNLPVKEISKSAFKNYWDIISITISKNVTTIGSYAFGDCTNLISIRYEGTIEECKKIVLVDNWNYNVPAAEIICSDGNLSLDYFKAIVDLNGNNIINKTVATNTEAYDRYGNKIVVPAGFKIRVDDTTNNAHKVTEGVVIEDASGNQFVWIPVGKIYTSADKSTFKTITLGRYSNFKATNGVYTPVQTIENYEKSITINSYYTEDTTSNHNLSYDNAIARNIGDFLTSATQNCGYYLGRYEAGDSSSIELDDRRGTSGISTPGTLVCKANQVPYDWIIQSDASRACQNMYPNGYGSGTFSSDLINSYAWDTAIIFIQTFGTKDNSSDYAETRGRPTVQIGVRPKMTGTNILSQTGSIDEQLNIYDMAGNCWELSTETCGGSNNRRWVARGDANASVSYSTSSRMNFVWR